MNRGKRILIIQKDNSLSGNGGAVVSQRNLRLLKTLYGEENIDIAYILKPSYFNRITGLVFNASYGNQKDIKRVIKDYDFSKCLFVFIDGSLEGRLIKTLFAKKAVSIVFYHNVEYNYYSGLFLLNHSLSSFLMKIYSYRQEKISTRYSSFRIMLNKRDASELHRIYHKNSDLLLPTSFDIEKCSNCEINGFESYRPYALFVGSDFYANSHGISWFIDNVLPNVKVNLVIAGSISSFVKRKYSNQIPNLFVLGYVDDLLPLYYNAICVISPIFLGSGLKTKTIEALMFGKRIIGTTEAFQGIEADYDKVGALCNTKEEFISSLNALSEKEFSHSFNQYSYDLFCSNFSTEVALNTLNQFLIVNKLL